MRAALIAGSRLPYSSPTPGVGGSVRAPAPEPADCPIVIVHGWNDAVVPVDNSIRYARQYRAALHILDGDHSLMEQIEVICELFEGFLRRIGGNETCSDA